MRLKSREWAAHSGTGKTQWDNILSLTLPLALPCVFPSLQDSCSHCWWAGLLPWQLSAAPVLLLFPGELFPSVSPCTFSCLSAKTENQVRLQFFKAFSKPVELPKMRGKGRKKPAKQSKNATKCPGAAQKMHPWTQQWHFVPVLWAQSSPSLSLLLISSSVSLQNPRAWGREELLGFQQGVSSWKGTQGWKFGVNTPCRSEIFLPGRLS